MFSDWFVWVLLFRLLFWLVACHVLGLCVDVVAACCLGVGVLIWVDYVLSLGYESWGCGSRVFGGWV